MSLGIEIAIEKESETELDAEYRFCVRAGRGGLVVQKPTAQRGLVKISKSTGEITLIEPCPDDADGNTLLPRVKLVLRRHWRSGQYPDVTGWAS